MKKVSPKNLLFSFSKEKKDYFAENMVKNGFFELVEAFFSKSLSYSKEKNHIYEKSSLEYYKTDVFLIGANPILNSLSILNAVKNKRKIIFAPYKSVEKDYWSYDFFYNMGFRNFVKQATSYETSPKYVPDWGIEPSQEQKVKQWIEEFFVHIKNEIKGYDFEKIYKLPKGFSYNLFKHYTKKQRVVYFKKQSKNELGQVAELEGIEKFCHDCFNKYIAKDMKLIDFSLEDDLAHRVFCRKIVLTSQIKNFTRALKRRDIENNITLDYGIYRYYIKALGSARYLPFEHEKAVFQAVEDILDVKDMFLL